MKSEHRHELAENDLSKLIDHGRDRLEPYQNKILLGVLAAAVVIAGAIVVIRTSGTAKLAGGSQLAAATTAADYDKVANDYGGTPVGLWSRVRAGELHLRDGIRLSLTNREASNESLTAAEQAFQQVLKADDAVPEMREQALFGLAVTLEAQTSETTTTKPAIDAYERLLKEFKDSRFRLQAESRIAELKTPQAGEFYAWFHAQNPKPEDRPPPRDFPNLPLGSDVGDPFSSPGRPADMPADAAACRRQIRRVCFRRPSRPSHRGDRLPPTDSATPPAESSTDPAAKPAAPSGEPGTAEPATPAPTGDKPAAGTSSDRPDPQAKP
ncbi:MAG: hypothetical protein U0992_16895 [Planctomycetaceae bacterium]